MTADATTGRWGEQLSDESGAGGALAHSAALLALAGSVAAIVSVALPWLHTGAGSHRRVYDGVDLPVLAGLIVVASATTVGGVAASYARRTASGPFLAGAASVMTVAVTGVLILIFESASALIPTGFLPTTLRRGTVHMSAGAGLWLALTGSSVAFTALVTRLPRDPWHSTWLLAKRRPAITAGSALLIAATASISWLRYRPWMTGTAGGQQLRFDGWATPWIGPASLLAVWMLFASCIAIFAGRRTLGALLAAAAGWLVTFLAALAIVATRAFADLRLGEVLPQRLSGYRPSFAAGTAAWSSFAAGLAAAGAAAVLLWSHTNSKSD